MLAKAHSLRSTQDRKLATEPMPRPRPKVFPPPPEKLFKQVRSLDVLAKRWSGTGVKKKFEPALKPTQTAPIS